MVNMSTVPVLKGAEAGGSRVSGQPALYSHNLSQKKKKNRKYHQATGLTDIYRNFTPKGFSEQQE